MSKYHQVMFTTDLCTEIKTGYITLGRIVLKKSYYTSIRWTSTLLNTN